jgi:phosphoribosylformylglycinamidine cyclo-ligase
MPGLYREGEFDLAGCIVGRVTPEELLTGEQVREGMQLYAWPSSGLHTNGYSLVRRVLLESVDPLPLDEDPGSLGTSLGEALMAVHRSYLAPVRKFRARASVAALCHITGGGLIDNLPRVLPDDLAVEIEASSWTVPPLFDLIARRGEIEVEEMQRVFNLGVGMVAIAPEVDPAILASLDDPPWRLGRVRVREADTVLFSGRHVGLP